MSNFNFNTPVLDENNKLTLPYQRMIKRIEGGGGGSSDGVIMVPSSATPQFVAGTGNPVAFEYLIDRDVTNPTLTSTFAGQLIIVSIKQDAVGGWKFTWFAQSKNFGVIDVTPQATSIQMGRVGSDGLFLPVGPMMINL